MKKILAIILAAFCTSLHAQNTPNAKVVDDPARRPLPEGTKGIVIDGTIDDSKIYPNTKRAFQVFVPQEYKGTDSAALVVGLDGNLFGAITVIDNLIKSGEMPVTIGIFLQPGVSYDSDNSVIRYNRSNEFDRTDARLASFLEQEVIPLVESMQTPDGRKILISHNPNDRAITGASSSGIAAFTVAWERPDLFARVYSSVGTFVGMRGGNEYPVLVRKTEPKAIRIFLQDGVNDTWNHIFGDWWEQNQLMASALNYAGYEFDYKWDRGNHSITYGTRAYPDAMRWLWRGWPEPVKAGTTMNATISQTVSVQKPWTIADPFTAAALSDTLAVLICEPAPLHKLSAKKGANMLIKHNGTDVAKFVANPYRVLPLHNGDKYISNSEGEIFLLKKDAKKAIKLNTLPTSGSEIAISPNGKLLVAAEKNSNWLISYIIAPDGTLQAGQQFYWLHNPDNHTNTPYGNMAFDTEGNLYVATPIGIQICDHNGRVRGILPLPGAGRKVDAIAFVGNRIFAKCGNILYVREVGKTGHNSWNAPIDVKSQGQG